MIVMILNKIVISVPAPATWKDTNMSLMGYEYEDVDIMAGQVLEAAVIMKNMGENQRSEELLKTWNFLDGLLEEGRV